MRISVRVWGSLAAVSCLALAIFTASSAASAAPHKCSGTQKKPGVLTGTYSSGVVVKGLCEVNAGPAKVVGTVKVSTGSVLLAAFGKNHKTHKGSSKLTVIGNVDVGTGASAIIGCKVNPTGSGFPCLDETSKTHPTLKSAPRITGSLVLNAPLGVVVHDAKVGGSWTETGGGGGTSCTPTGPFAAAKSPVYSNIEDSTVGGNLTISGMSTCWVGVARVNLHGNATFTNNDLADPDGIEIVSNTIGKNLSCTGNSHPAGSPPIAEPVWDSGDPVMGKLFPRIPQPNTVTGTRSGQCVLSSPTTPGGASGPGAF